MAVIMVFHGISRLFHWSFQWLFQRLSPQWLDGDPGVGAECQLVGPLKITIGLLQDGYISWSTSGIPREMVNEWLSDGLFS